jgi:hypothetical protein
MPRDSNAVSRRATGVQHEQKSWFGNEFNSSTNTNVCAVADGAFDLLILELTNSTRKKYKDTPNAAVDTLDSIGFNIGRRLVEK